MTDADGRFEPFPDATNRVFAFGLTYLGHIKESGEKQGAPVIFDKLCRPRVEPDTITIPTSEEMFKSLEDLDPGIAAHVKRKIDPLPALMDYEVELGMVLLEPASSDELQDPSWMPKIGYFLANDLTARSVQIIGQLAEDRYAFWAASKSFPSFLPVASHVWCPAKCDPEAFPQVSLNLRVNGEVRQSETPESMIFTPRQMIEIVAQRCSAGLEKGDIILTGTPSGVAMAMSRFKQMAARLLPASFTVSMGIRSSVNNPSFLKAGDVVEQSADWLGSFRFRVS